MQQSPSLSKLDLGGEFNDAIGRQLEEVGCGGEEIN